MIRLAVSGWLLLFVLGGCATGESVARGENAERAETADRAAYSLLMAPTAAGYTLGGDFLTERELENGFEYRGTQAGHRVYHRKIETSESGYTDLLLHVGPGREINKIVLLRRFDTAAGALRFYGERYERQKERYLLARDSGNSGDIRFYHVEAYPDPESWQGAYDDHFAAGAEGPFRRYYHPLIARSSSIYVFVEGVPTVARIYEGHNYPGESR